MTAVVVLLVFIMMIICIQCNNIEIGVNGQPNNNDNDDKKTDSNNSSNNDKCPICTRVIRLVIDLAKDRYQRYTILLLSLP